MFAVRALDFRRDVDGKMVLKHINKDSRNTAVFMQTCGTVAEMLCAQCSQGCGPFEAYIVFERDRVRPIGPTCATVTSMEKAISARSVLCRSRYLMTRSILRNSP